MPPQMNGMPRARRTPSKRALHDGARAREREERLFRADTTPGPDSYVCAEATAVDNNKVPHQRQCASNMRESKDVSSSKPLELHRFQDQSENVCSAPHDTSDLFGMGVDLSQRIWECEAAISQWGMHFKKQTGRNASMGELWENAGADISRLQDEKEHLLLAQVRMQQ